MVVRGNRQLCIYLPLYACDFHRYTLIAGVKRVLFLIPERRIVVYASEYGKLARCSRDSLPNPLLDVDDATATVEYSLRWDADTKRIP